MNNVVEFPMLELKYAWREASHRLKEAGIAMPLLDSRLLLQHAIGISYEDLLTSAKRKLTHVEMQTYADLIHRRLEREPVSVIIGEKPFWKHVFKTSVDTLDPRPDSETLVDILVKRDMDTSKDHAFLELGVGTGALILSLLHEYPKATGFGVDISEAALEIAAENAKRVEVESRVHFAKSDWFDGIDDGVTFDVIISNPPYIPSEDIPLLEPEVAQFDPMLALDGGADGLDAYRILAKNAKKYLNEGGILALEIGVGQGDLITELLAEQGLEVFIREKDLHGIERVLLAQ